MKRGLKFVLINVFLLVFFLFIVENAVYLKYKDSPFCSNPMQDCSKRYYYFKNPVVFTFNIDDIGRKMPSLEKKYKNTNVFKNPPIVVFGCSFAYGFCIDEKQTFEYKLSEIINRNVINRAVVGGGLQHMYYQSTSDEFYKIVPYAKDVIFITISDHPRRMLVNTFDIESPCFSLHYDLDRHNKLKLTNYKNPILNFIRSLYISRIINQKIADIMISNYLFSDKITDEQLAYFLQTRENLEKRWGTKVNFNVIVYDNIPFEKKMVKKLKNNGFNVIQTRQLVKGDIRDPKFYLGPNNGHPSETAWDIFTPLIAEKLNL